MVVVASNLIPSLAGSGEKRRRGRFRAGRAGKRLPILPAEEPGWIAFRISPVDLLFQVFTILAQSFILRNPQSAFHSRCTASSTFGMHSFFSRNSNL